MRHRFPFVAAILLSLCLYAAVFAQDGGTVPNDGTIPSNNIYLPLVLNAPPERNPFPERNHPQIVSWSFAATIDTRVAKPKLIFEAHFTDDLSGVSQIGSFAHATFLSHSGRQEAIVYFYSFDSLISGDTRDGIYRAELPLQRLSERGQWKLDNLYIEDAEQNFVFLSSSEVAALGLPTSFKVTK